MNIQHQPSHRPGPASSRHLSWEYVAPSAFTREQWCADGDGLLVVVACKSGYRILDNNGRHYVGKEPDLQSALQRAEDYMKANADGMFDYLRQEYPAQR